MDVSLREAVPADAARIRDVHLRSIEKLGGQAYSETQVVAWAHDRDPAEYPIDADNTHVLVAEDGDDEIVGFGWLRDGARDHLRTTVEGELVAVYVHPSVARRGTGSRLYEALEAKADSHGIRSLGLWASLNAVPFYEVQGYNQVTTHGHEYRDGVELTLIEMAKRLS